MRLSQFESKRHSRMLLATLKQTNSAARSVQLLVYVNKTYQFPTYIPLASRDSCILM